MMASSLWMSLLLLFVLILARGTQCEEEEEYEHYDGSLEDLHLNIFCFKYPNGSHYMKITWVPIKGAQYYTVGIASPSYKGLIRNITENEFVYHAVDGFVETRSYQGLVLAYPRINQTRKTYYYEDFEECPKSGVWTQWSSWSECHQRGSEDCSDIGERFIERKCVTNDTYRTTMSYNACPPVASRIEKQICWYKKCPDSYILEEESGETLIPRDPEQDNTARFWIVVGVLGCVISILVVSVLVLVASKHRQPKKHPYRSVSISTGLSMYISHLTPDNKELRILELVQNITSFGVQCVIDLLCQVDINSRGGLANWLPFSIKNADKILVVVTPNYLRALHSAKPCVEITEEQICKVNTEFHFIQSLYYQEMQQTPHVSIVLDGVKQDELPEVFRGRIHCRFPKTFHSDDDDAQKLIGLVLGEEPLRIV